MSETIDTDCMTMTRWLIAEQQKFHPTAHGELTQLLTSIQTACKAISSAVRSAGISGLFGTAQNCDLVNVQGETVKKLDRVSNELFVNLLKSSHSCCALISEENEAVIEVDEGHRGHYIVAFDPLDGSSNIDCLVSIGSIFAVFKKSHVKDEILQSGRKLVVSGYCLYGSATQMVLCLNGEVNGFTLDPTIGEFLLTEPKMKIPAKGNIYSINEGNESKWLNSGVNDYIKACKVKAMAARYTGSMVADVHRTIKYGGVFLYPASKNAIDGKLRVLYECFPMAHIVECAGGKSVSLMGTPTLDIKPKDIHQRAPIILGSRENVDEALKFTEK